MLKSAADLQHKEFEELRFIVPKYLPEGCALLAGRPKVGKSWLALDAGIAVSSGGACMGQQCEQGDVLGLFLEDTDRRLQRRMLGAYKDSWPASLTYATGWPRSTEHASHGLSSSISWSAFASDVCCSPFYGTTWGDLPGRAHTLDAHDQLAGWQTL